MFFTNLLLNTLYPVIMSFKSVLNNTFIDFFTRLLPNSWNGLLFSFWYVPFESLSPIAISASPFFTGSINLWTNSAGYVSSPSTITYISASISLNWLLTTLPFPCLYSSTTIAPFFIAISLVLSLELLL